MEISELSNTLPPSRQRLIHFGHAEVRYGFNPDIPLL